MLPEISDKHELAVEERGFQWLGNERSPHPAYPSTAWRRQGFRLNVVADTASSDGQLYE
jgi:hypothetical protein